jgi:hypothetical protein
MENINITLTKAQFKEMLKMISDRVDYRSKHYKEVNFVPRDSVCIGYEQASYGDWTYYITPEGEYVCTYYSIGD